VLPLAPFPDYRGTPEWFFGKLMLFNYIR
jgi:hypothetical protein